MTRISSGSGFLILGVLSLAASSILIGRAVAVEATLERVVSAVLFGCFGLLWMAAYYSGR